MVRVFVEGSDDEKFIVRLLQDLRDSNQINLPKSINFKSYINIMGSKSKLLKYNHPKYAQVSKEIEVGEIKKVLFIFDCDFEKDDSKCGGMDNSLECFENLKKELGWNIPFDVYIFNRNLDYFLLETIDTNNCYEHFRQLEECLDVEKLKPNKKPIANLYRDLYPHPQFDFKHPNFNGLKQKLINLFKGI